MRFHRCLIIVAAVAAISSYQAESQDLFDVIKGAMGSTLKNGKFTWKNFLNDAATEGVTMVVKNLTIYDPSQGRDVSLDSYCHEHFAQMLGPSMAGSQLAYDPLGTIVRSFMNENYLLDANLLYYPALGRWISINEAQNFGVYGDVTSELTALHSNLKTAYRSGNVGGFTGSMQLLIRTLEGANSNQVASVETRAPDPVQPPVESPASYETPPAHEEPTVEPTPTTAESRPAEQPIEQPSEQPPVTDNVVKVFPKKTPHIVDLRQPVAVPLDSVFVANRITRDMGKLVKMAMGRRAGTVLNTRCKVYSIRGERLERIAYGYVAAVTPDDCTIRITGLTGGRVCRPGDIVIFELPRDFLASITRH